MVFFDDAPTDLFELLATQIRGILKEACFATTLKITICVYYACRMT